MLPNHNTNHISRKYLYINLGYQLMDKRLILKIPNEDVHLNLKYVITVHSTHIIHVSHSKCIAVNYAGLKSHNISVSINV